MKVVAVLFSLFVGVVLLAGCSFVVAEPEPKAEEEMMLDASKVEEVATPALVRTIELPFFPHDIALDRAGNLYVVEFGEARVHKFDAAGSPLAAWGSSGSGEGQFIFSPPPGGPPLDGGFVTVDEIGNVYVSDTYNNRIQKFDTNGLFLAMWEQTGADGVPFQTPGPISADLQGYVYVADLAGIYQFDLDGGYVRTLAGVGMVGVDSQGNRYATNAFENTVVKLNADGSVLETWGSVGTTDSQFTFPLFLVVDEHDHLYVADRTGRIQILSTDGTFLGSWNQRENGDSPFTTTAAIALDEMGNLYAANPERNKVYVFSLH